MNFPKHSAGLYLAHNPHKGIYQSSAQWIMDDEMFEWKDKESQDRAISTNEIWTLQWYPDTPVGFIAIAAPTLDELMSCSTLVNENT